MQVTLARGAAARLAALAVALIMIMTACQASAAKPNKNGIPDPMRVGIIPNVAPDTQRARYQPFRKYLERKLGVHVTLFVASDYAGVINALAAHKLDMAYLGGLSYVQAAQQVHLTPLVTEIDRETGRRTYLSAIIVKSGSRFRSVRDLLTAHASFAFGDVSSTSGSLYPRLMLVQAGARCHPDDLTNCPPLSKMTFTGGHDATARAVLNGSVDAGGLELRILHRLERQGTFPKNGVRVIATHQVMGYPWVASGDLGKKADATLIGAFQAVRDPKLLDLLRARRYARVSARDYAEIRRYAKRFGLLNAG